LKNINAMKTCFSFLFFFLVLIVSNLVLFLSASKLNYPTELSGYWAIQSVSINGNVDKGEKGSYLIFRKDGTFRIAKRGKKPEGTWDVSEENKLVLKHREKLFLEIDWCVKNTELTLSYMQGNARVVLKYLKEVHETEPKAPDED